MEGGGRMISVDRWGEGSQAYFLTHLHSDHTRGLTASWSRGPLYCSPVSARLLPSRFPGLDLSLVRVLDVGVTYTIPLLSSSDRRVLVHVTPIDAHHCPGAVMYLFKGEFGCRIYTGDFRWESTSERTYRGMTTLLEALSGDNVDVLYLDNTYCHPSFSFPSRFSAAQQVIDVINLHPNHDIVIGIDKLGKEDLLLHIAHTLNVKIWVWPERLQTMHILGLDDIFTTKTSLTRIRAVPRYSLTVATLASLNEVQPTVGIMPSGLPWEARSPSHCNAPWASSSLSSSKKTAAHIPQSEMKGLDSTKRHDKNIYTIPYSDHSCFKEIKDFIELVRPLKIIGIVPSSFCYNNPGQYFHHMQGGKLPDGQEFCSERAAPICKRSKKRITADNIQRAHTHMTVRRTRVSFLRRHCYGAKLFEAEIDSE